jgi:hypothetical protein
VLPDLTCAEMWFSFNLGRLDLADTTAQTLTELGRRLGNTDHILDAATGASRIMLRCSESPR